MAVFKRGDIEINYEEYGSGYPLLLFAPGGMRSSIEFWHSSPFDPTVEFADGFRVIAMDQRNAGASRAPITAADGWDSYTSDHLALIDHLGLERLLIMGGCIGCSYCFGLIQAAPDRVSGAVLQQPIGLSATNRDLFRAMFDGWADGLRKTGRKLEDAALVSFRERMYGGDFVFNVSRDFVKGCATPMLLLAGNDDYHPAPISREVAELAPNIEVIPVWKTPETVGEAVRRVRTFLDAHAK